MRKKSVFVFVIVSIFLLSGCLEKNDSTTVAKVGEYEIDYRDFQNELKRRSNFRRKVDRDQLDRVLNSLVEEASLAQMAIQEGFMKDPVLKRKIRALISNYYINNKVRSERKKLSVTEQEQKAYFRENKRNFERPEELRIGLVHISKKGDPAKQKRKAEKILKEFGKIDRRKGFRSFIIKNSEPNEIAKQGYTKFFDRSGAPIGMKPEIAKAAFEIKKNNEVYPEIVETEEGYNLIVRVAYRPAYKRTFQQVQRRIRQQLMTKKTKNLRKTVLAQVKADTDVAINDTLVDEIVKDWNEKNDIKTKLQNKIRSSLPIPKRR